jgi:glutamyl-tRNA synthetase
MHLATARAALYDYLLAKQTGGKFILRIEDTDVKRTVPGSEHEIVDGLRWLGLEYDEGPDVGGPFGPYRQTERQEIYREHATLLRERGFAYPCFCTPERLEKMRQEQQRLKMPLQYDGLCRRLEPGEAQARIANGERHVIRFKVPKEGTTTAHDVIRGDIVVENQNVDDYVLLKSDGLPTYHLAAMVDDHLMQITHVLRGAEWLSTFPLHVNVIRAFGWEEPLWIHLSLFLKPSGKGKLSKRDATDAIRDGYSVFIKDMQDLGFIPEGVLNWIVLMGWGVAEGDVLTLNDMIDRFDVQRLTASPAAINFTKLDHFNGAHIRLLSEAELARRVKPYLVQAGLPVPDDVLKKVVPLIQERISTLDEAVDMAGFFFKSDIVPAGQELIGKGLTERQSLDAIVQSMAVLEGMPRFSAQEVEPAMRGLVERLGLSAGQVFGVLRVAVTGQQVSPPLFESMEVVGRDTVMRRLQKACDILRSVS